MKVIDSCSPKQNIFYHIMWLGIFWGQKSCTLRRVCSPRLPVCLDSWQLPLYDRHCPFVVHHLSVLYLKSGRCGCTTWSIGDKNMVNIIASPRTKKMERWKSTLRLFSDGHLLPQMLTPKKRRWRSEKKTPFGHRTFFMCYFALLLLIHINTRSLCFVFLYTYFRWGLFRQWVSISPAPAFYLYSNFSCFIYKSANKLKLNKTITSECFHWIWCCGRGSSFLSLV